MFYNFYNEKLNDNIVYELVDKYRKMISLDEYMKNNALVPLSYYDISIDYASICFIFKHTLYDTKHIYNINHVPYDNKDIYNKLNQHDKDMFNKISLFMNEFKGLQI